MNCYISFFVYFLFDVQNGFWFHGHDNENTVVTNVLNNQFNRFKWLSIFLLDQLPFLFLIDHIYSDLIFTKTLFNIENASFTWIVWFFSLFVKKFDFFAFELMCVRGCLQIVVYKVIEILMTIMKGYFDDLVVDILYVYVLNTLIIGTLPKLQAVLKFIMSIWSYHIFYVRFYNINFSSSSS